MLSKGDIGGKDTAAIDDGLRIAKSKLDEMGATDPEQLCGLQKPSRFGGFREVSDRALQDVSSALKEVSVATGGGDGVAMEDVLCHILKIRKEINHHIHNKLNRLETSLKGGHGDIMRFHLEAKTKTAKEPEVPKAQGKKFLGNMW